MVGYGSAMPFLFVSNKVVADVEATYSKGMTMTLSNSINSNTLPASQIEAQTFLDQLAPSEKFTFMALPESNAMKGISGPKHFHGELAQHAAVLESLNQSGWGIYVTVNATDLLGRKAENIVRVRAFFLDLDGAPLKPVLAHSVRPDIVVSTSPGRWHVYWKIADCPLDRFTEVQKSLIALYGGDPAVSDLPRVMRLPGFVNHKYDAPYKAYVETNWGE